ncbi:hypothetical protein [Metaclostridioides mangenotii]|nr:hypothetical protein [Clostridioides mangenotii]
MKEKVKNLIDEIEDMRFLGILCRMIEKRLGKCYYFVCVRKTHLI